MKKIKLFLLVFLVFQLQNAKSQCSESIIPKILLIGDSWAFFMNADQTFNTVLNKGGHSNYEYVTTADLAVNGARTEDFLTTPRKNLMETYLNDNPSVKVVHVSLGGNDFLGDWKVSYTLAETEALKLQTKNELIELFDFLKSVRPDIQIVWSGYMYANFEEIITEFAVPTSHPFYGNWENMEFPSFEELNTVLNEFSADVIAYAAGDPQLTYIHAPGLMQYYYGQTTALGVAPGGTYAPLSVALPDGDLTYPSPKVSMRNYGLFLDCFHLSPEGYEVMLGYQMQKFYHKVLMDDIYLLSEIASETGSIGSGGSINTAIMLGESGGESFTTHLSFNTPLMADTILASASLFLHRDSIFGSNPIGSTLSLKMINGSFGTSPNLEAGDLSATFDISGNACVFGSSSNNGDWIRIDLPLDFLPYISAANATQFLISVTGGSDQVVYYSNGTNPEFAPVLNLRYKYAFASVQETGLDFDLSVYPNPASQTVTIKGDVVVQKVTILNIQGEVIKEIVGSSKYLDLSDLTAGTYFLKIQTNSGIAVRKVIHQ